MLEMIQDQKKSTIFRWWMGRDDAGASCLRACHLPCTCAYSGEWVQGNPEQNTPNHNQITYNALGVRR